MSFETVTMFGVALARTGTWQGITGEFTITTDHFEDAIKASTDPEVSRASLKFGHESSLNAALGDGAPAYGWVENLSVSPDGTTLLGDLTGIPEKLAPLIGRAYKQRSIEMRLDVETPSGRKYLAALTGLALLGAAPPAVKGMEDLAALYASADHAEDNGAVTITLSDGENPRERKTSYTGDVSDTNPAPNSDTGVPETIKETATMAFLENVREALGLDENATEDEVLAAVKTAATAAPEAPADEAEKPAEEKVEEAEPVAASEKTPAVVTLSAGQWADIETKLAERDVFLAEKAEADRKATIEAALSAGKITPAERATWETALAESPESTRKLLDTLPARVNMSEGGTTNAQTKTTKDEDAVDAALDRIFGK